MANFEIPENPQFVQELRKFQTSDPGHADVFNKVIQVLLENEVYLFQNAGKGSVKIGAADTPLDKGDTLFIVEGMPLSFRAAAFDNLDFGASPPENGDYWAGANPSQATKNGKEPYIINGKLAVSTEQDAPKDTAFLAKINNKKEREETENGK